MRKKMAVLLMVFALIAGVIPVFAKEPTATDIVPDVLLVRPVGLVSIVVGAVIFVISLPVAIPTGSVGNVGRRLMGDPAEYTFVRPVGDFEYKLGTWGQKMDAGQ